MEQPPCGQSCKTVAVDGPEDSRPSACVLERWPGMSGDGLERPELRVGHWRLLGSPEDGEETEPTVSELDRYGDRRSQDRVGLDLFLVVVRDPDSADASSVWRPGDRPGHRRVDLRVEWGRADTTTCWDGRLAVEGGRLVLPGHVGPEVVAMPTDAAPG